MTWHSFSHLLLTAVGASMFGFGLAWELVHRGILGATQNVHILPYSLCLWGAALIFGLVFERWFWRHERAK